MNTGIIATLLTLTSLCMLTELSPVKRDRYKWLGFIDKCA